MTEYEIAVGAQGVSAEAALNDYESKLCAAFEAHRSSAAESRSKAESKLAEIAEEYLEIGSAFHKTEEAQEQDDSASENECTDETDAAENEECVSANEASDSDE